MIDMSKAVVVRAAMASPPERKAVCVLVEEIHKRTGIRLQVKHRLATGDGPAMVVGSEAALRDAGLLEAAATGHRPNPGAEGYRIGASGTRVAVVGTDPRGVLFGVGRLLRNLRMGPGFIRLDASYRICTTPRHPLRGHQLGYRPINNTVEAWTYAQFDQYVRDLALFGANAIEIMPGGTDDDDVKAALKSSAHCRIPRNWYHGKGWPLMRYSFKEALVRHSEIIHSYGLDVWLWWPNMGRDYSDPACVKAELAEREKTFRSMPYLDQLFVPGGDPGEVEPDLLFRWMGKMATVLHRHHPKAGIWLSLQAFQQADAWIDRFVSHVKKNPPWLTGLVFAPWQKASIREMRRMIPARYPIRHYPDITHNINCQYPVPNWDVALALALGRECINPRPRAQKHIHNLTRACTMGSLSYSEGINDDVNKFVWSDQDWDPATPVESTLRDYGRLFFGDAHAESAVEGLLGLERNWEGPLAENAGVEKTLRTWQRMETKGSATLRKNYRFQLGLIRAHADAFVRQRLLTETELERMARRALESAKSGGSLRAMARAEAILNRARRPVASVWRRRCDELARQLFRGIGMQLSVKKYHALAWNRGAFMDTLDIPLNSADWLKTQFAEIRTIGDEAGRLARLKAIVKREEAGRGGCYESFGQKGRKGRAVEISGWEKDPGHLESPFMAHSVGLFHLPEVERRKYGGIPLNWISNIHTLYDTPLVLAYDGLDRRAVYRLKVTYLANFFTPGDIRLVANGRHVIHEGVRVKGRVLAGEYAVPPAATSGGRLELTWTTTPGAMGVNLAELWLIRSDSKMVPSAVRLSEVEERK